MAKKKNCTLDEECEGGRHAVLVLNVRIDSTFRIKTVSGVLLIFDISLHMIHHIYCILSSPVLQNFCIVRDTSEVSILMKKYASSSCTLKYLK